MPSGRTHLLINLVSAGVITAAYLGTGGDPEHPQAIASSLGYLFGSVWVTPDLDMKGVRTAPLKAWGVFGPLWNPFLHFSRHRGVSHTYLRGPLLRLLYIATVFFLLTMIFTGVLKETGTLHLTDWNPLPTLRNYGASWYAGYLLSQWLHLIADKIRPKLENM